MRVPIQNLFASDCYNQLLQIHNSNIPNRDKVAQLRIQLEGICFQLLHKDLGLKKMVDKVNEKFELPLYIYEHLHQLLNLSNSTHHSDKLIYSFEGKTIDDFAYQFGIGAMCNFIDFITKVHPPNALRSFLQNNEVNKQSNPYYEKDLLSAEGMWKLNKLLNKNTVIIVTGCHLFCELLDRPVAEYLKKEIDLCGDYKFGKRAIIMGDGQFLADTDESRNNQITEYDLEHYNLQFQPIISIGDEVANALSRKIIQFGASNKYSDELNYSILNVLNKNQIALWGNTATATKETVVEFVKNTNSGLTKFLEKIW